MFGSRCQADPQTQVAPDFNGAHAVAFSVALQGVHIAEIQVRTLMEYGHHEPIPFGYLLHIDIATVHAVVDGQHTTGGGGNPDDPDHGFGLEFQGITPVHDAVFDSDVAVLNPELFFADPIGKNADARPQCRKAQAVHADIENVNDQHLTGSGPLDLDWPGGRIDKGQGYVFCAQFFMLMRDQVAADIQFGFNFKGLAVFDFRDKRVGRRQRIFQRVFTDDLHVLGHTGLLKIDQSKVRHGMSSCSNLPTE